MKWLYNTHLSTRIILTSVMAAPVLIASPVINGNDPNGCTASASVGRGYSAENGCGLSDPKSISRGTALMFTPSVISAGRLAARSGAAAGFVESTARFQIQTSMFGTTEPDQSPLRV